MRKDDFENMIHCSIIDKLEQLERKGEYNGNPHDLSNKLCELIGNKFDTFLSSIISISGDKFIQLNKDELHNGTAKIIEFDVNTNKICIINNKNEIIVFPISDD